jgi:hypothetical protein
MTDLGAEPGGYTVHAVSGDPGNTDSTYRSSVEAVPVVSDTSTGAQHWIEGTVTVIVTDAGSR